MKNIINIVLVVLVTMAMGQQRENIQDIVREMVAVEMKTRDDAIEKKMKDMNVTIATLGKELTAKDATFDKEMKTKDATIDKLVREVSFLKDPPYTFFCAYRGGTSIYSGTIKYDKLLYSSTSIPDSATMDISSGIFTSGWGGTYTVTWSLSADDDAGDYYVDIYLRKNGESITESVHFSRYTGPSGFVTDQGGRTLLLRLDRGDTVELWCNNCSATVEYITFCVTMSSYDYDP